MEHCCRWDTGRRHGLGAGMVWGKHGLAWNQLRDSHRWPGDAVAA